MQKEFRALLQLVREIGSSITIFIERAGAPIIFGSQPRPNLPLPHFTMECVLATVVEVDGAFDDSEDLFGNDVPADGLQMDATTQQHQSGPPSRQSKPSLTNTPQPPTRCPQQWALAPQHGLSPQQLPHGATTASPYQAAPQNFWPTPQQPLNSYQQNIQAPQQSQQLTSQPRQSPPGQQHQCQQPQRWQPTAMTCHLNPSDATRCSYVRACSVPHPRAGQTPRQPNIPSGLSAPQARSQNGPAPLQQFLHPVDQHLDVAPSNVPGTAHHAPSPAQHSLRPPQQTKSSFQLQDAYAGRDGMWTSWGQPPSAKNNSESEEDEDAVPGTPPDSPLATKRARW